VVRFCSLEEHTLGDMRFVFRADASQTIGSGHVMRLSIIAEEAISQGIPCVFIGEINGVDWLTRRVQALGFQQTYQSSKSLPSGRGDVLFVDSYDIRIQHESIKRVEWGLVVVIADEVTPKFEADIFVHPGINDSWFKGDRRFLFSGPSYIPLRKTLKNRPPSNLHEIKRIVVVGGGTDVFRFSNSVARELVNFKEFDSAVFFSDEKDLIQSLDERFEVEQFGSSLDRELLYADLAITTAGTVSLEIAASGIPSGIACATENQRDNYFTLNVLGISTQIGEYSHEDGWKLNSTKIGDLVRGGNNAMSISHSVFDFEGAARIINLVRNNVKLNL